ncbi:hypothetical protein [Sandarakinorhabdus sp.]|uniref:hypothetical protein n=1 Tax=Sandarakinorhabdus sp. TaxID=1916663 RepID=UPI00286E8759|nr:hypothetical protein [Sandarakinorhabdus sp.]
MGFDDTFWLAGAGAALMLLAIAGTALRRRAPLAWHAHLPWNGLVFVGAAIALLSAVHLMTLLRRG